MTQLVGNVQGFKDVASAVANVDPNTSFGRPANAVKALFPEVRFAYSVFALGACFVGRFGFSQDQLLVG